MLTDAQVIATLSAALQFYGNPHIWERDRTTDLGGLQPSVAYRDEGARARLALRAVGIEPGIEKEYQKGV